MLKVLLLILLLTTSIAEVFRIPILTSSGISLSDAFIIITFVIWGLGSLLYGKRIKLPSGFVALLLFLFTGFISLLFFIGDYQLGFKDSLVSFSYLLRYGLYASVFVMVYNLNEKDKVFVLKSLFGVSFLILLFGFIQLKLYPDFQRLAMADLGWDPHIGRMLSTWFDPNYLGGYFSFIICLALGVSISKKKEINKYLLFSLIGLLVVAIILTYSRSALLSLMIGSFVFALFVSRKLLFIGLGVAIMAFSVSGRLQDRVMSGVKSAQALFFQSEKALDPTARLRLKSWQIGIDIYKENPIIGAGFNTLTHIQKKKSALLTDSHGSTGIDSSILTIMAMTGTFGLMFFLSFLYQVFRGSLKNYFRKKDGYSIGLFAALCGLMAHSIFVNSLFFYAFLPTIFIALGLMTHRD